MFQSPMLHLPDPFHTTFVHGRRHAVAFATSTMEMIHRRPPPLSSVSEPSLCTY